MISKRLELVASFVPQGAILLDVGSDHAYLPIELVERGQIKSAIAGEVVEGPYQSAVKNVEAHGLKEKIQVRLANGLAAFELDSFFKLIELDAPNRFVVLSSTVFVKKPLDLFPLHRVNEL